VSPYLATTLPPIPRRFPVTAPESNGQPLTLASLSEGAFSGRRFGRRTLIASAFAGAAPLMVLARDHGHHRNQVHAQSVDPNATPGVATPEASPTPRSLTFASPVASPQPIATVGQLRVVEDQHPTEATQPVAGGDLHLYLPAGGNGNYNPAAFRQDFQ